MNQRHVLAAGLLFFAALNSASAIDVTVVPGSGWQDFFIDDPLLSLPGTDYVWHDPNGGGDIAFILNVLQDQVGTLRVTSAGYSGDVYSVRSNGLALANTGPALNSPTPVFDYDTAFADANFSKNTYTFSAGTYKITGAWLSSSRTDLGVPAGIGAVNFSISAVPEPSTLAMLVAGLGVVGLLARRRAV